MSVLRVFLFSVLLTVALGSQAGQDSSFFSNLDQAKAFAQENDRDILMVFAGSDWCRPCIQFKRFILESEVFTAYSKEALVVLYLDFPSGKKNQLSAEQTAHNEKLAEKYNPHGAFPNIVLLNAKEVVLGHLKYTGQTPESFVSECKKLIPEKTDTEKAEQLFPARKVTKLMGCRFEISATGTSETMAWNAVEKGIEEISRIEKLISSWDQNSRTSEINRQAGKTPVWVEKELFDLINRSKKISQLTEGAFDISFASMDRIWTFDGEEHEFPDSSIVREACSKINWQKIILNAEKQTVFLQEEGMKIGFGAIGKGFAANRAKSIMSELDGIVGGAVNASGDLIVWGENPSKNDWTIQIADPKNKDLSLGSILLQDMAIVTSGNYEKYLIHHGVRYAHIIDPKTGYPTTGIKSVSIICPDTEVADALATSVFALGKESGLELINALDQVECMIVTGDDELITSKNININYYE